MQADSILKGHMFIMRYASVSLLLKIRFVFELKHKQRHPNKENTLTRYRYKVIINKKNNSRKSIMTKYGK